MAEFWRQKHWIFRGLFVAVALVLLFLRLLPLGSAPGALPGPDLLVSVILAWIVRRPDFLPMPLILMVILAEDLILMRPPGLWTAIVILATEFLRGRIALTRELSFVVEWLLVSGVMLGMMLVYRLILGLALVPQAPFGFAIVQVLWSIAVYPVVVALSRLALDLRKPATGEVDDFGRRL
ncbi:rod shape-determining protein MreD [Tabrizicola sp.]|jgi:rod shape-determining protein MreD|uniref:rod shape-determining protein MreD n=1 Tax=Tabrizicola sp. TaxID=2005166 RepID=UPI0025E94170|nr:rod shape-determining protein MreD [Tabrizicola sp.]MBY0350962.1 rod shape-determining protein MreD [Tabrizicola sp.]MDK2775530.1 rod shape-determining protein MreD [Tabrizicola sp.]